MSRYDQISLGGDTAGWASICLFAFGVCIVILGLLPYPRHIRDFPIKDCRCKVCKIQFDSDFDGDINERYSPFIVR